MASLAQRYIAAMVLSGVGDAMGFKNGNWEFCHSGAEIHREAKKLGGIEKLEIKLPNWKVSDDTVMHLATAEAYLKTKDINDKELLYKHLAEKYKESMHDMSGRSPGPTTMNSCHMLKPLREKGYEIPFDPRGGGCGAAMRAMCIGLRYPRPEDLPDLIADGIESGRMTHHHPTGFLGSLAAALFTAYAIQSKPVEQWGAGLMQTLPKARDYIKKRGHAVEENLKSWDYFENAWKNYLERRNITSGQNLPVFPNKYDIEDRDEFYKSLSFSGWGGASGHDAPMIAYDALLGSGTSWIELCKRGILHSGDNDSTGVMAGAWFGARYGFDGVPDNHYEKLEYRERLEKAGKELLKQSGLNEADLSIDNDSQTSSQSFKGDSDLGSQSCTVSSQSSPFSVYSEQEQLDSPTQSQSIDSSHTSQETDVKSKGTVNDRKMMSENGDRTISQSESEQSVTEPKAGKNTDV